MSTILLTGELGGGLGTGGGDAAGGIIPLGLSHSFCDKNLVGGTREFVNLLRRGEIDLDRAKA